MGSEGWGEPSPCSQSHTSWDRGPWEDRGVTAVALKATEPWAALQGYHVGLSRPLFAHGSSHWRGPEHRPAQRLPGHGPAGPFFGCCTLSITERLPEAVCGEGFVHRGFTPSRELGAPPPSSFALSPSLFFRPKQKRYLIFFHVRAFLQRPAWFNVQILPGCKGKYLHFSPGRCVQHWNVLDPL